MAWRAERSRNNPLDIDDVATSIAIQVTGVTAGQTQRRIDFNLQIEDIHNAVVIEVTRTALSGIRLYFQYRIVHGFKVGSFDRREYI